MNKVKFSLFALVALLAASCVQDPFMDEAVEPVVAAKKIINVADNSVDGKLIIYVDEATADAWTQGTTRSGVADLEAVALEHGVESVEPVFNMQMNAEKKRAFGLHRWYTVLFSKEADKQVVAKKFAELNYVKKVQFSTIVTKPEVSAQPFSAEQMAVTRAGEEPFNDPKLPLQWHYNNKGQQSLFPNAKAGEDIGAYGAWNYTTGNRDIVVAVMDEGVCYSHPDLNDNMWVNQAEAAGADGVDDDNNGYVDDIYGLNVAKSKPDGNITWNKPAWDQKGRYTGDSGHGTHVAGTISAVNNNGIGVAGVAGGDGSGNGVRIMSIQIFDGGSGGGIESNAKGYVYAADMGACISQNSWGYDVDGFGGDSAYSGQMGVELAAIRYFQSTSNCSAMDGGVVIFAAGNDTTANSCYPGAFNEFISVTAYAPDGVPTTYTNYGKGCNVAAPGGETEVVGNQGFQDYGCVLSTIPADTPDPYKSGPGAVVPYGEEYGYMQGTSMACPHVSGVAALLLSYAVENGLKFTQEQLCEVLTSSVRNIDNTLTGSVVRHYYDHNNQIKKKNFDISVYNGQMGTGKLDATLAIMNLRGATCIPVVVGEEYGLKIGDIIGTGDINITMLKEFVIPEDVKQRLGITSDFFSNTIFIECTKPGIGVITVKYIAGGNAVGGGETTGGKLMEKEVVIISRENNDNGAWL